jgi:hypothetical protein
MSRLTRYAYPSRPNLGENDHAQPGDRRDGCIARTAEGSGPSNQGNALRMYRACCNAEHGTATRRSIARPALRRATRLVGALASRHRVSAGVSCESNNRFQNLLRWYRGGSNLYRGRASDRVASNARLRAKLGFLFRVAAKLSRSVQARRDARS